MLIFSFGHILSEDAILMTHSKRPQDHIKLLALMLTKFRFFFPASLCVYEYLYFLLWNKPKSPQGSVGNEIQHGLLLEVWLVSTLILCSAN